MKLLIVDSQSSRAKLDDIDESIQSLQKIDSNVGSVTLLPNSCIIVDRKTNSDACCLALDDIVKMVSYLTQVPLYAESIKSNGIKLILYNKITRDLYTETKFHNLLLEKIPNITLYCKH